MPGIVAAQDELSHIYRRPDILSVTPRQHNDLSPE
jgi:hypothetical protein